MQVINLRYTCGGMHFDAAIDYGHILHSYTSAQENYLPIELYNLDRPDWDICMLYIPKGRPVELKDILDKTNAWCNEMEEGA